MVRTMITGLDKLTGLTELKEMTRRDIKACLVTGEPFPHSSLFGPRGLGKTYYTECVAEELGSYFFPIEGTTVATKKALIDLLFLADREAVRHKKKLLFFIDEAHRLGKMQEALYYPLSKCYVQTKDGIVYLEPFTLFAATTHPNMLLPSFVSRLPNQWYLRRYDIEDMKIIVAEQLSKHQLTFDGEIVESIAARCLGIPRLAYSLCLKMRNAVLSRNTRCIEMGDCYNTFRIEGIDEIGLRRDHLAYMNELFKANGTPKGLGAISGRLGLDEDVVSGNIEPTLLEMELIDTTSKGRILTRKGFDHLSGSMVLVQ